MWSVKLSRCEVIVISYIVCIILYNVLYLHICIVPDAFE